VQRLDVEAGLWRAGAPRPFDGAELACQDQAELVVLAATSEWSLVTHPPKDDCHAPALRLRGRRSNKSIIAEQGCDCHRRFIASVTVTT